MGALDQPADGRHVTEDSRPHRLLALAGGAAAIRASSREGEGFVVFPEGEILNYVSGRRNPIRHKLYLPGYLNARNERGILAELEIAAPAAVVVWRRALGKYGAGSFGEDYGREIRRWIGRNYERKPPAGSLLFEYYVRRAPVR